MNILFVSHLGDGPSAGPHWSVPARIKAQAAYDNVLWVNTTNAVLDRYKDTGVFHPISEFGKLSLKLFSDYRFHPDVVLFEGFYSVAEALFARQLKRHSIPYIITPRGSLTWQSRHNSSKIKKDLAHFFLFDSYIKNALSIQFLTENEKKDSKGPYHDFYVLPNGMNQQNKTKVQFSISAIKGLFIGRIDNYHKGLDVLLDAILRIKDLLREKNFILNIYGPLNSDSNELLKIIAENQIQDIVSINGEVSGKNKEGLILDSDVFFLTSRFEGHPMGLIEALSYGLPVFVTPGTNMDEEVMQFNAGWSCECTVESIMDALRLLVNTDKPMFYEKSNNALLLSKQYDWNVLANSLHHKLSALLRI